MHADCVITHIRDPVFTFFTMPEGLLSVPPIHAGYAVQLVTSLVLKELFPGCMILSISCGPEPMSARSHQEAFRAVDPCSMLMTFTFDGILERALP
jgi:hypothetical protein